MEYYLVRNDLMGSKERISNFRTFFISEIQRKAMNCFKNIANVCQLFNNAGMNYVSKKLCLHFSYVNKIVKKYLKF